MGFEFPLALVGLIAAAGPLVVHLLRRRDLKRIELPTIAFLARAQSRQSRRLRLVDLLLLVLRMFMIACLVAALSQPFLSQARPDAPQAVVFVLDDSMSMFSSAGGETQFARATEQVRERAQSLAPNSELSLVLAGEPPRAILEATTDRGALAQVLAQLPAATGRGAGLVDSIPIAARTLRRSHLSRRSIVVLSDFAGHTQAATAETDVGFPIEWIRVGPTEPLSNAAVTRVIRSSDPTTPGEASVEATVHCMHMDADPFRVMMLHRGERTAVGEITECDPTATVRFHVPEVHEGDSTASVEIEIDDALDLDDRRGFLLRSSPAVRVLLVNGDPQPRLQDDELGFFRQALVHASGGRHRFAWQTVDEDSFVTTSLATVDVVAIVNARPSAGAASQLVRFVEDGGGVLLAVGDRLSSERLARWELVPSGLAFQETDGPDEPGIGLEADWLRSGPTGLAHTETRRRLWIDVLPLGTSAPARFSDGTPALLRWERGAGQVALLTTTLDDDWTSLPFQPGYLSLVARVIDQLAPPIATHNRSVASGLPVALPTGVQVTRPDGTRDTLQSSPFTSTDQPGTYQVTLPSPAAAGTPVDWSFVVEPATGESDLTPGEIPEASESQTEHDSSHEALRIAIAPWFLLAFGMLFLAEAVLRNRLRGLA